MPPFNTGNVSDRETASSFLLQSVPLKMSVDLEDRGTLWLALCNRVSCPLQKTSMVDPQSWASRGPACTWHASREETALPWEVLFCLRYVSKCSTGHKGNSQPNLRVQRRQSLIFQAYQERPHRSQYLTLWQNSGCFGRLLVSFEPVQRLSVQMTYSEGSCAGWVWRSCPFIVWM